MKTKGWNYDEKTKSIMTSTQKLLRSVMKKDTRVPERKPVRRRCINCMQSFYSLPGIYFCKFCLEAAKQKESEVKVKKAKTTWKTWEEYVLQAQRSAERTK